MKIFFKLINLLCVLQIRKEDSIPVQEEFSHWDSSLKTKRHNTHNTLAYSKAAVWCGFVREMFSNSHLQ